MSASSSVSLAASAAAALSSSSLGTSFSAAPEAGPRHDPALRSEPPNLQGQRSSKAAQRHSELLCCLQHISV